MAEPRDTLDLLDYRRAVNDMYRRVRHGPPGEETWAQWRGGRDNLFASHSQTALDPGDLGEFDGLPFFDYDPGWRVEATVEPIPEEELAIGHSDQGFTAFRRFGQLEFELHGAELALSLYWLDSYGGGVFLPFRDSTSGEETYGGGRYLLDTAKGADLGHEGDLIVLDFNYAYHPSCVYSYRWSCPLAPSENQVDLRITAGERL
ncbi:MAG: DUF1684 domain-containing protein [Acidimicrobiia bacterium]